jgi:tripartite-type tricarboxylate transporter receptor subunit TctC
MIIDVVKNILKITTAIAARAALVLILASASTNAIADGFPDRPIKFLLGFGAGGPTDIVARTLATQITKDLDTRVIVENRPGASGNLATQAVATADADGYTYLIGASPLAVNESLFPELPVKFGKDLVAVAPIGATANVLVVNPSLNVHSVAEFVARAGGGSDAVSYATVGIGSSSHLAGVALDLCAGTKMLPISYRGGGEALKDMLAGRVDAWFAPIASVLGAVRAGQLIALSTTGPERTPWLPEVPTMSESGFPGFDSRLWVGVFARPDLPADTVRVIEPAIVRVMASIEMRAALETQGITPLSMSRAQFNVFVMQEIERWKTVVAAIKK